MRVQGRRDVQTRRPARAPVVVVLSPKHEGELLRQLSGSLPAGVPLHLATELGDLTPVRGPSLGTVRQAAGQTLILGGIPSGWIRAWALPGRIVRINCGSRARVIAKPAELAGTVAAEVRKIRQTAEQRQSDATTSMRRARRAALSSRPLYVPSELA